MYEALSGYVISRGEEAILIGPGTRETNAVGFIYRILVPTAADFKVDEFVTIAIHHQKTEFTDVFYGFKSHADRLFFRELLKADKVGPHAAMAVMRLGPIEDIKQAIRLGRPEFLQRAAGVNKAAENIILKLQPRYLAEYEKAKPGLL